MEGFYGQDSYQWQNTDYDADHFLLYYGRHLAIRHIVWGFGRQARCWESGRASRRLKWLIYKRGIYTDRQRRITLFIQWTVPGTMYHRMTMAGVLREKSKKIKRYTPDIFTLIRRHNDAASSNEEDTKCWPWDVRWINDTVAERRRKEKDHTM